ncbi:MAG: hypothetical protein SWQ30_19240 [Thermodesulfobacteriota bacterium]|nr:hypothetical protein [Thermodesulfobacteriota bacterium]
MRLDNLPDKIVESMYSPELDQLGIDLAEVAFDALLKDGTLKNLPIIGSIVTLFKGTLDIRDRICVAKIAQFLFNLASIPLEQRESFEREIRRDAKTKRKVGTSLVLILDRLNDIEKTVFLVRCFGAYLCKNISFDQFRRLSGAIDIAFVDDLRSICRYPSKAEQEEQTRLSSLSRTGFVEFRASGIQGTWNEMGTIEYSLSPLGRQFVSIVTSSDLQRSEYLGSRILLLLQAAPNYGG